MRYKNNLEEAMNGIKSQLHRKNDLAREISLAASGLLPQDNLPLLALKESFEKKELNAQLPAQAQQEKDLIQNVLNSLLENHISSREFLAWQMRAADLDAQYQNAKRNYNSILREFNSMIESFPGNLLAKANGIKKGEFIE